MLHARRRAIRLTNGFDQNFARLAPAYLLFRFVFFVFCFFVLPELTIVHRKKGHISAKFYSRLTIISNSYPRLIPDYWPDMVRDGGAPVTDKESDFLKEKSATINDA